MSQLLTVATALLARNRRAACILAASLAASGAATCTALMLVVNPALFGPLALYTARVGCVAISGVCLASGWWAIDDLLQ
jgi:hypothetical protein